MSFPGWYRDGLRPWEWPVVVALALVASLLSVYPPSLLGSLGDFSFGIGQDEVSFLFIFDRLSENLLRLEMPPFDGRMLFPFRDSLVASESMPLSGLLYRAVLFFAGERLLAFNLTVLLFLVLNAGAFYWLARHFFGAVTSFLVSLLFAYSAIRVGHLCHTHCLPQLGFPLFGVALVRYERTRNLRYSAGMGAALALQYYLSITLGNLLLVALLPYAVYRLLPPAERRDHLRGFFVTLGVFALAAAPLFGTYLWVASRHGFSRRITEAIAHSANWRSYLMVHEKHLYAPLVEALVGPETVSRLEKSLFIGLAALFLMGAGVAYLRRFVVYPERKWKRDFYYALAFVIVVSFGWNLGVYVVLYYVIPVMRSMRTPGRFGLAYLFLACLLAGFGIEWLKERARKSTVWRLAVPGVFFLALLDNRIASQAVPMDRSLAGVTAYLAATADRAPLAHVPVWGTDRAQVLRMFHSLEHRHPIVNGYCGFHPPAFVDLGLEAASLVEGKPSHLWEKLSGLGVGYVALDRSSIPPGRWEPTRVLARERLGEPLYADEAVILHRLAPRCQSQE